MEKPIRGPDSDRLFLDSAAAAAWIGEGIGEKAFDALMARHLPTVRPIRAGRKRLWTWLDCAVLAYLLARGEPAESEEE